MGTKPDIELHREGDRFTVSFAGKQLGAVQKYDNPFHGGNSYLKITMDEFHDCLSQLIFQKLVQAIGCSLQVMVDSSDKQLISFIKAGGFICRRKCYIVEAVANDYVGKKRDASLYFTHIGESRYTKCCEMMYHYYRKLHAAINPLTATQADFFHELPQSACYELCGDRIVHCAFLEENEIAYVCSEQEADFCQFAKKVICWLFSRYETICFESDDCDTVAMKLNNLFVQLNDESYDTYIYDYAEKLS